MSLSLGSTSSTTSLLPSRTKMIFPFTYTASTFTTDFSFASNSSIVDYSTLILVAKSSIGTLVVESSTRPSVVESSSEASAIKNPQIISCFLLNN